MGAFETRATWKPQADAHAATELVAAFDIGCGKTACLIGRLAALADPIGAGWMGARRNADGAPNDDFTAASRSVRSCLDQAERMAGGQATTAISAYGAPGVKSMRVQGAVHFPMRKISERDVRACLRQALSRVTTPGLRRLHVLPLSYRVDGGAPILDPRGAIGSRLTVDVCVVTAPEEAVAALSACLRDGGIVGGAIAAAPYMAGLAVLTEEERNDGAIVIDIGAGGAGIAAFRDGEMHFAATIQAGGVSVTRALAKTLKTSFAAADRIKIQHGRALTQTPAGGIVEIPVLGADGKLELGAVRRSTIEGAVAKACSALLARLAATIAEAETALGTPASMIVVTGGAAQIEGLVELVELTFDRPARLGAPLTLADGETETGATALSVAAGLLVWAAAHPLDVGLEVAPAAGITLPSQFRAKMHRAFSWLWENF